MNGTGKVLYWIPRILSIIFICFITMFSLDVFEEGVSLGSIALGLFIHNIPSLIMIVLTVIAWRKEIVGAIGFILVGFLYIGFSTFKVVNSGVPCYIAITWNLTITAPALIIGFLYLCNWKKRKENKV